MTQLKDVLHLYLGCKMMSKYESRFILYPHNVPSNWQDAEYLEGCKPILRPLSSMAEEEMKGYWQALSSEVEEKITTDEIDVDMFYNDGGLMVDGDIEVGANISCRCFEGQIAIRKCGSTFLFNEDGNLERLAGIPEGILYLLKKGFDLFGLIQSGQAIDATKQILNPNQ